MSRALRMSRRRWRRAELTVGAAELAVGVLVCSGASPMLGGAGHGQAVVFQVSHAAPSGRLAVHVSLRDGRTPGSTWPAGIVSVQDLPG